MKYLRTFESVNKLKFTEGEDRRYYFSTDRYDYRVMVYQSSDGDPPSFGFKAKKKGDTDFNYDQSIITNDNLYLVMRTILEILSRDMRKYKEKSYIISSYSTRKGKQRMNLYRRVLTKNGWVIEPTEFPTYFLIKKRR